MDRDLVEKLLTAQVLTLAAAMKARVESRGSMTTSNYIWEAVREVRAKQAEVIGQLLAPPEPETAGS